MLWKANRLRSFGCIEARLSGEWPAHKKRVILYLVSRRHLLVVDADPAVHDFFSGLVTRDAPTIQGVYDGRDALEHLKTTAFDLVVAGQGQNGLNGVKLLRRLRAVRPDTK